MDLHIKKMLFHVGSTIIGMLACTQPKVYQFVFGLEMLLIWNCSMKIVGQYVFSFY